MHITFPYVIVIISLVKVQVCFTYMCMLFLQMMDERSNDVLSKKLSEKEKELAETKKRETECKATLSSLRRTAAKLIRALNEVCHM